MLYVGADDRRARLRDLLRGPVRAARGGALLRRHRRRRPAGAVRAHRLARQGDRSCSAPTSLVQQLESNVTIPIIMSQRVRLHPAVIAIGVVVVGQLFGFVGLFVAVPILSLIMIAVEEFWVKPIEEGHAEHRRSEIELPEPWSSSSARIRRRARRRRSQRPERQTSFTIAITIPISDEDHDQDLDDDPEARQLHGAARLLDDRLTQRDRDRVHARVRLELEDRALRVRLDRLGAQPDPARDLLGVEALGEQLEDLALALGERRVRARPATSAARATATGPRTACRPRPCGSRAAGPPAASPSSRSRARRRRSRRTAGACRRRPRT